MTGLIPFPAMRGRRVRRAVWPALGLLMVACAPVNFSTPGPVSKSDVYEKMFPYHADLCAVSQISKKPGYGADISGGPGGHAVMFLGGVCLDRRAGYPVLTMCDGREADRPDGVGLSMNSHYSNANWTAAEGRDFYFNGTLAPDAPLTRADYVATQKAAQARGIYDGVIFHKEVFDGRPANMSPVDWKYEMSVATDYAITLGRARYCARLPVTQGQMRRIVDFLNDRNAIYRNGPKTYESNVLQDNCNHLIHNALAAADVWGEWPINRFVLLAALSFPVPKNELVNLIRRTETAPVDDLLGLYHDPLSRRTLMRDNWLPDEPGVLLESQPVHMPNAVYNTNLSLIFYDDPVLGSYHRYFGRYLREARYHDLRANLSRFAATYARIQSGRRPLAWWVARHPALAGTDFAAFYDRYYAYVALQTDKVAKGLAALDRRNDPDIALRTSP